MGHEKLKCDDSKTYLKSEPLLTFVVCDKSVRSPKIQAGWN